MKTFVKIIALATLIPGIVMLGTGLLGILGKGKFQPSELATYPLLGTIAIIVGLGLLRKWQWAPYGYLVLAALQMLFDTLTVSVGILNIQTLLIVIFEVSIFLWLKKGIKRKNK